MLKHLLKVLFIIAFCVLTADAEEVRRSIELSSGWRFHQGDIVGFSIESPDTTGWEEVSVPHTWNRVGYYLSHPEEPVHRKELINKHQGVSWYSLQFLAPEESSYKQAWLQFDAASRTAEVWLNGERLGEHRGGFSRFRFNATSVLRPGRENTLIVRVDNSQPTPGSSTSDTLPLAGDFFIHGGIYRPVSLITTSDVHVDMEDSGSSGIYASTDSISNDRAKVKVRARLRNSSADKQSITARISLIDSSGGVVSESSIKAALKKDSIREVDSELSVAGPRLWDGTSDPYLYTLKVELFADEGVLLDRVNQSFGIRQFRIDPNEGFLLNDKPIKLHGVAYHQDLEGKGWAMSEAEIETDVKIIKEMGANTIRLSHYQHGQTIHNLADKHGLILWDEVPLVTLWTAWGEVEPSGALKENARQQLRELIRQNYNHPSVITWGLANEVDFGNSMPLFLAAYKDGNVPDPLPLLRELNQLAKAEDPGRPTVLATCCEGRLFDGKVEVPEVASVTDLGGANRYFGWYYGKPEDLDGHLDTLRDLRPEQPLSVTEYGAGGATTIHTDNVLGGSIDSRGRNQPEEYESYIHEENWATLSEKGYLWATWIWNSFDFSTTIRKEGDAIDINTKGLVTYDRKIRKDAYYFYKANWTDAPMVYITGRRYTDRAYRTTPVRVYSNLPKTELLLNGNSLGIKENCENNTCEWSNVTLSAGGNILSVRGVNGGFAAEDSVEWYVSQDVMENVRIDSGALVAAPAHDKRRFGSDTFFHGGDSGSIDVAANYGRPARKSAITGTLDRDIAATYREGRFSYKIPVKNGHYDVLLTFMEPSEEASDRQFDVFAGQRRVVADLDVAAEAGAARTEMQRTVHVEVTNNLLDLHFIPSKGKAIVSAVEVSPASR